MSVSFDKKGWLKLLDCHRPVESRPAKPPGKNWPNAFEKRHPELKARREKARSHESLKILQFCFENNIILCRLPSHTSHRLQPCDVAVFGPLKHSYRAQVDRLERGGVNTIGKQQFTSQYSPARVAAFTRENIRHGFEACGLVLFNLKRVLGDIPTPPPADALSIATSEPTPIRPQEVVLQTPSTPLTPLTPRTSEAFVSLQNEIIKHYARGLDERKKQRLHRTLGKFVNAGEICLVQGSLQQDRIRSLMKINDESKDRRSTKSDILAKGEGLVISYEHLLTKRAARAAYEQAKAFAKEKRG